MLTLLQNETMNMTPPPDIFDLTVISLRGPAPKSSYFKALSSRTYREACTKLLKLVVLLMYEAGDEDYSVH